MLTMHLYIGPTFELSRAGQGQMALPEYCRVYPPVKQGSIYQLLENERSPGIIVIVDGYIEHEFSVSHSELRSALDLGWQVYGLGDIGAIRAYEMRYQGMRGYGQVYHYLQTRADCSDDEILWAYDPQAPDTMNNEPLIHMRCALKSLIKEHRVSLTGSRRILQVLQRQWFKDRTLDLFIELLQSNSPNLSRQFLADFENDFDRFRIKLSDFEGFISGQNI